MKSSFPLLIALALGGALMSMGSKQKQNPVEDEDMPTSLDYSDPELAQALEECDEDADE